ncbi:MAG: HAD-IA family hydrolase [Armatimonadetes bacterium]|nr:HAD-IA family hydrolase [Armatimonadota bacterium]
MIFRSHKGHLPMLPLRALLFDFDGTILDTETPEYETWQIICAEYDVTLPLAVWATGVGIGVDENPFDPYRFLEENAPVSVDRTVVKHRRAALFAERLAQEVPRPGIIALLEEGREAGLLIGLASSSGHSWVDGLLERIGLLEWFPVRLCADDVTHTKPDPELYLRCLSALGVSADEAMSLEDSPNGIKAAKAAGIFTVAYPNRVTALLPGIERADIRVDDWGAVSLASLAAIRNPAISPLGETK